MLTHFICPDKQTIAITDCLKSGGCRLGQRCLTWSMLERIGRQREWKGIPSVTQLTNGTCQAYLQLVTDYATEPDDEIFKLLGSRVHDFLAKSLPPDSLVEERLFVDGITGAFDEYTDEDGIKILTDYKVSAAYKVAKSLGLRFSLVDSTTEKYQRKTTVKDENGYSQIRVAGQPKLVKKWRIDPTRQDCMDWTLQLNKYAIMLKKYGFSTDSLRILAIVRDGGTARAEAQGVFHRAVTVSIPRLDADFVETYFEGKKNALLGALASKTMPGKCSPEETWDGRKCEKYCPVRLHCPHAAAQARISEDD